MELIKLSPDFSLEKYGVQVRLVNEDDADFILRLRTDSKLSRYIHSTDNDLEKQKEWIRGYKEREAQGTEFYFMFLHNGERAGVRRLYSIKEDGTFTGGSWLFLPDIPMSVSIVSMIISLEVAFGMLHLTYDDLYDGVHESNTKVIKFCKMLGVEFTDTIIDEKGKYFIGGLTKETFYKREKEILELLNITC
jgi:hypothetical protein